MAACLVADVPRLRFVDPYERFVNRLQRGASLRGR